MSARIWSRPGIRRLDFGGGGGEDRKKQILLGAGLGVLVIGALVLVMIHVFGPPKVEARTLDYMCTECGHTFQEAEDKVPDDVLAYRETHPMDQRTNCPGCGGKLTAHIVQPCPKCGKPFVSDPNAVDDVCPECRRGRRR